MFSLKLNGTIASNFPPWHIYLDVFLLGMGTYLYLRTTQKIKTK